MKKTKYLFVLSLLPVVASLIGCNKNVSPNEVVFWMTGSQKASETLKKKATTFQTLIKKNTGKDVTITIETAGGYDDIKTKIEKGYAAGNVPTMAVAYPDHVADYLRIEDGKYVYNLANYINDSEIGFNKQAYLGDAYNETDFEASFWEESKNYTKEGIYSLPYMKSSEVLFYNEPAAFKAIRGYKNDKTMSDEACRQYLGSINWDTFMELCQYAYDHKTEIAMSKLEYGAAYDSDENFFITKMFQKQIPYSAVDASGKGVISFDKAVSQENYNNAVAMVTEFRDYHNSHKLITKGSNEGKYSSDLFKEEKIVFTIGSSGGTGYNVPSGGFTVGVTKVPSSSTDPENKNLYVSQGPTLAFLKNPKYSDELNDSRMKIAWQFAKYITNAATNVELCIYGSEGYYPVRKSALENEEWKEFLEEGEIYAATAKVLMNDINGRYFNAKPFKGSADLRTYCGGIVTSALTTDKDIKNLFDTAIEQAKLKIS